MKSKLRKFLHTIMLASFLAILMGFNCPLVVQASPSSFTGEWLSRTIDGVGSPNNDPGCLVLGWTDRKISLEQIPGNPNRFRGEWVRKWQALWMAVRGETCRFQGETKFQDSHLAVLGWTLSGSYDPNTGMVHVIGTFNECTGSSCPQQQAASKDFSTDLRIMGADLVDADPSLSTEEQHHFIPNASEQPHLDEIMQAVKPLLDMNDNGQFDQLYQHMDSSSRKNLTVDQARTNGKAFRAQTGALLSRSPMATMYALYSPLSKGKVENAIVMSVVYFPGNRRAVEYVLLTKESGDWKLAYYYVGGGAVSPQ
jgi:hypothetical protein